MDYNQSSNFARYKTYAWMKSEVKVGDNSKYNSDLINRNIKYAVETEFAKRGIEKMTKGQADFLVGYHTYTEKKQQTTSHYGSYPSMPYLGYGWGWRPWSMMPYGGWGNGPRNYTYTEGTLIIDLGDNRTKGLVWRGAVEGDVDNIARLQKKIQKGVEAIMKQYPAKVDQSLPENTSSSPVVS